VTRTFGKLSDPSDLYDKCLSLSESLANDLHDERLVVSNALVYFMLQFIVFICYMAVKLGQWKRKMNKRYLGLRWEWSGGCAVWNWLIRCNWERGSDI